MCVLISRRGVHLADCVYHTLAVAERIEGCDVIFANILLFMKLRKEEIDCVSMMSGAAI